MKIEITKGELDAVVALRGNAPLSEAALEILERLSASPKRLMALNALLEERERLLRPATPEAPREPAPKPKRITYPTLKVFQRSPKIKEPKINEPKSNEAKIKLPGSREKAPRSTKAPEPPAAEAPKLPKPPSPKPAPRAAANNRSAPKEAPAIPEVVSPPREESSEPAAREKTSRSPEPLSEEKILAAAHAFMQHTKLFPFAQTPGVIPGLPGDTWQSIDKAARLGLRGLAGGRTLQEIIAPLWLQPKQPK